MIRPRGRQNLPTVLLSFGRHLVYAEGTKTEPYYVEDLKLFLSEELHVDKKDIEIVAPHIVKSKHTCELVEYARNDVMARKKNGETINYVWVFYDKDSFDDFDEAYRAIQLLNSNTDDITWFACWSNECFEVWAYHYFEKLNTPLSREDYIPKINEFLKKRGCREEYRKNRKDLHHFLTRNGGSIEKAMKWMKEKDDGNDKKPNPSSGIYQFAEYLLAYLTKGKEKEKNG